MGSPVDWQQIAHSPEVQQALADPQIAGALMHNYRMTGGQMPFAPMQPLQPTGMADGGGVPTPEDVNRLQQIRGGDVDPSEAESLQMLAQDARPPRFADGGNSTADLDAEIQQINSDIQKAEVSNDSQTVNTLVRKRATLMNQRAVAGVPKLNAQASAGETSKGSTPGGVSFGGFSVPGSTMQSLQKLGQTGPPTVGNTAATAGLGAVLAGLGTTRGPSLPGALVGAATAGLLNYFVRKNAQQRLKQQQQQGGQAEPNGSPSLRTPGFNSSPDTTGGSPAPQGGAGPPLPPGPGLWKGTANVKGGDVTSSDGKNWYDSEGKPVDPSQTPIANQTRIKSYDQPTASDAPSAGGASNPNSFQAQNDLATARDIATPDQMNPGRTALSTFAGGPGGQFYSTQPGGSGLNSEGLNQLGLGSGAMDATALGDDDMSLAKGGPVKGKKVPVLHIVIAPIPKIKGRGAEKPPLQRAMGGDILQSERSPRRPAAVPPGGPPQSGLRLPHGRVQVPRGSGSAIRGKRFGGIF
jgi:hypothetical protein